MGMSQMGNMGAVQPNCGYGGGMMQGQMQGQMQGGMFGAQGNGMPAANNGGFSQPAAAPAPRAPAPAAPSPAAAPVSVPGGATGADAMMQDILAGLGGMGG